MSITWCRGGLFEYVHQTSFIFSSFLVKWSRQKMVQNWKNYGGKKTSMKVTQSKLQFEVSEQCLSSTVFVQVIDCLYLTKPVWSHIQWNTLPSIKGTHYYSHEPLLCRHCNAACTCTSIISPYTLDWHIKPHMEMHTCTPLTRMWGGRCRDRAFETSSIWPCYHLYSKGIV